MARIRTIKPEFWSSEQVMECSPNARLLFIGIWNFCDDVGRHPFAPRQLKVLVFPGDAFTVDDVRAMLGELAVNGLIEIYSIDGKEYFQVTGWNHQKIDKPQKPKFPGKLLDHSANDQGKVDDHYPSVRDGIHNTEYIEDPPRVESNSDTLSVPAAPDADPSPKQVKKPRNTYPPKFEEFWKAYPTDQNMSKSDASIQFSKLSAEDQDLAIASCPIYRAYCRDHEKSGYRPKHADGYLRHRRFVGHAEAAAKVAATAQKIFIKMHTPQWEAWSIYLRETAGRTPTANRDGGWYYETEWPPQHGAAA